MTNEEHSGATLLAEMNRIRELSKRTEPVSTGYPDCDLLRRAADLMIQRALAANTDDERRPYGNATADPVPEAKWGGLVDNYLGGNIGKHCASWTPVVAIAVAVWLDTGASPYSCVDREPMLAVARPYLAEIDRREDV